MSADVFAYLTSIDGRVVVGWALMFLMFSVAAACQIAGRGQSQAVRSRPASSNRKSGRVR